MKMTISLPISNYLGIALQINRPASPNAAVELALEHSDRAFSVPLCRADHACDVVADWQSLSSVLGIPSLLVEADGGLREAFARVGALRVGSPTWRRRRRSAISGRRPRILLRRKPGRQTGAAKPRTRVPPRTRQPRVLRTFRPRTPSRLNPRDSAALGQVGLRKPGKTLRFLSFCQLCRANMVKPASL